MKNFIWVIACGLVACTRPLPEQPASEVSVEQTQQQVIVDRATRAITRLGQQPRFAAMSTLLSRCRAVLIFPRLIKASLIVGGEGGNGVMLSRSSDAEWSSPAFYSLGAPSVGLQAGFRESTAVLFIMNDITLQALLHSSMTLGAQTSATLGHVGERGLTEGEVIKKDIYVLAEAGGAFAGVSLDGYVIATRKAHNDRYYGPSATPRGILIERRFSNAGAAALQEALRQNAQPPEPEAQAPEPPRASPNALDRSVAETTDYRPCSPESRQAASCTPVAQPVCGLLNSSCDAPPCEQVWIDVGNACEACRNITVKGYRLGDCATTGLPPADAEPAP